MAPRGERNDTATERDRYERRARDLLERASSKDAPMLAPELANVLSAPYREYARAVTRVLRPGAAVLELGAGTGMHSGVLCAAGVDTTLTDISPSALKVLRRRLDVSRVPARTFVTPMESTPFADSTFDLVASAGSLSYADPSALDGEIARVLKPGGSFVCVDSLNHNPVYRLNRWVHWRIRGDRTRSTLLRMPTVARMEALGSRFHRWSLHGFGAWSWLWAPLSRVIGDVAAARCNDACDRVPGSRRMAFKFVFEAHGLRK
jgi:ubiquinone/menaquinone biosynthesis C-methylase UbiE